MASVHFTCCNPSISVRTTTRSLCLPSKPYNVSFPVEQLKSALVLKNRRCRAVRLLGGEGQNGSSDEVSPWKSLEKAMSNLKKESSIEDVLRQQIEKKEFYEDKDIISGGGGGGGGGAGSGGGGGSGSGGRGADGSGGSEDEGFAGIIDETFQVVLATFGFIFLYIYIITGEEWTRLAKDYLKFLFSGSESVRLKRAMYKWGQFYQKLTEKKVYDKYWLEKAIISTPTWYDSPVKYQHMLKSLESNSDE